MRIEKFTTGMRNPHSMKEIMKDFYAKDGLILISEKHAVIREQINIIFQSKIPIDQLAGEIIDLTKPTSKIVSKDIHISPEKSEVYQLLSSNRKVGVDNGLTWACAA